MNRKDISGTQKSDSNYKDVMNLYKVLQMNDAKKEEWNELHFLLDARFLLTKVKKNPIVIQNKEKKDGGGGALLRL